MSCWYKYRVMLGSVLLRGGLVPVLSTVQCWMVYMIQGWKVFCTRVQYCIEFRQHGNVQRYYERCNIPLVLCTLPYVWGASSQSRCGCCAVHSFTFPFLDH
ncbi:hypothetical protein HOY82DRAFT_561182 [Tuber indicum]|nr:hypothetical protein HOY82DRAFT_561182 [Tuber indicum]